jgi:hypothetical protein
MTSGERGTALAETALMVGFAIMIVFNALQLAVMGIMQLHTDAVAFTAARYVAEGGTQANYPAANFPPAVTLSVAAPAGQIVTATATASVPGLIMVGAPSSVTLQGQHQEAPWGGTVNAIPAFSISEKNTQLVNAYSGVQLTGTPSTRPICLAHSINATGNGNGNNAVFATFQAHSSTFSKVNFPSSWSATLDPQWDITNKKAFNTDEATIYGWDKTATNPPASYCSASDV